MSSVKPLMDSVTATYQLPNLQQPNQLHSELMGISSLNPFDGADSASRKQMFASHLGQSLVLSGSTERYIQTGMEMEFGKYTFSVKMPCDGKILKIVERYRKTMGQDSIVHNPETIVIYERNSDKEVGVLSLPSFCSQHQYFGFQYVPGPALNKLAINADIREGEIFLNSPSITPDGGYKFGRETNVAFMSHHAVSEDGIVVCEDVLKHFRIYTYEHRVIEWGQKRFAINLYGDNATYKPFPDIGDVIRDDGLLMALREFDPGLAVVEQNVAAMRTPDDMFDRFTYAAGGGGVVVDVKIFHDGNQISFASETMRHNPSKYDKARRDFYQSILDEYKRMMRDHRGQLKLSDEFHKLVVEAMAVVGDHRHRNENIRMIHRKAPLDEWRVELTVRYEITPTIGFKLTDCHGGKGVICYIAKRDEMPVDEDGNRAEIIMDGNAGINRMNLGRFYELYINAASRDTRKRCGRMLGINVNDRESIRSFDQNNPMIEMAWEFLMGYYSIVSPRSVKYLNTLDHRAKFEHLQSVLKSGIYTYSPTDNEPYYPEIVDRIEESGLEMYRPIYGPVTFVGSSGALIKTERNVRVGSLYVLMLEKIADDWTAVSSGKLQAFGVLSQVTNSDKYSQPTRQQAIRALGEAEVRIYASYVGPEVTADILDRHNSPFTHKQMLQNILSAEQPTNIWSAVDRNTQPLGGSKPVQLVKHILECGGARFVYKPSSGNPSPGYIGNNGGK